MIELTEEQKAEERAELIELYGKDLANNVVTDERLEEARLEAEELKEKALFDLDGALDSYDETFSDYQNHGMSDDAIEFFVQMRLVQGSDFEFDTPIAHYFMVDNLLGYIKDTNLFPYSKEICDTIELDVLFLGFMASRGLAKSTLVISFFAVYSAIKGKLPNGLGNVYFYLLLAASSKGGARVNALAVRAMCEDSLYLKDYFEDMRFTESESEFVRKNDTDKDIPKKDRSFLIRYQGINTGVRGSRYGERRIDAVIMDDTILNTAAAYSKIISENLDEIIHSDATNALKGGGKGRVILCFTPFHYGDVNTKAILNGAFTPILIPMARSFDLENPKLKESDIHSSWEGMHPAKSIISLIRRARRGKKLKLFLQERMLRLTSGADRLIPDSCIQFCDTKIIEKNIHNYNIYITTDYTTTSGEGSDFSGIATWAVSGNEDWFLLNLSLRKMGMEQQYTETLLEAAKWKRRDKHVQIGVEVDGNQQAHIFSLEKMMMTSGEWYTFARQKGADSTSKRKGILSKNSGVSKHERFRIASQVLINQKMWFPEHLKETQDMIEFIQQIKGATHKTFTRADDGPDLITQGVVMMDIMYPNVESDIPRDTVTNGKRVVDPFWGEEETAGRDANGYSSYNS